MRRRAGAVSQPPSSSPPAAPQPVSLLHSGDPAAIRRDSPAPMGDLAQPWVLERLLGARAQQQGALPMNFSCLCSRTGSGSSDAAVINVRSERRARPVSAAAEQPCRFVEADEQPSPQASSCPGFWKGLGDGGQALQTCRAGAPGEAGLSGDSVCAQARG